MEHSENAPIASVGECTDHEPSATDSNGKPEGAQALPIAVASGQAIASGVDCVDGGWWGGSPCTHDEHCSPDRELLRLLEDYVKRHPSYRGLSYSSEITFQKEEKPFRLNGLPDGL